MTEETKQEAAVNTPPAMLVPDEQATIIAQPAQPEKTQEPVTPRRPAGKWGLIMALLVVAAVIVTAAVVALQVLESQFYSQAPSAWPASSQAR